MHFKHNKNKKHLSIMFCSDRQHCVQGAEHGNCWVKVKPKDSCTWEYLGEKGFQGNLSESQNMKKVKQTLSHSKKVFHI